MRAFLGMMLVFATLPRAQAQGDEPSPSEMALARQLFGQGIEHAQAERWAEARDAFERSYGVVPVPVTLYNLAGAQVQTGELVAGLESYRAFIPQADTGLAARYKEAAQNALAELEPRIPHVTVRVAGLESGDLVYVDDDEIARAALGVALPVDPGSHTIRIRRGGQNVASRQIDLAEGANESLDLNAASAATFVDTEVEEDIIDDGEEGGEGGLSPWVWVGIGGGVLAVALVVILAVALSGGEEEPFCGNVGCFEVELRSAGSLGM